VLYAAVTLLLCFSLAALYSIGISGESADLSNFNRQIFFIFVGFSVMFLISLVDYRYWRDLSFLFYVIAAISLVLVLFFGRTVSGTTGWFSIFGFNFQPVEFAKISLIITLASYLSNIGEKIKQLRYFVISGLFPAFLFGLVMLQPDFGSGVMFFVIWFIMVLIAQAQRKHLLALVFGMLLAVVFAWLFLFQPYQKDRILTFLDPQADPYDTGYQVRQSVIAIGAGGIMGRGLGFGSQSQLKFIPASQTDFIFAVIAEELGLFGVTLILFFWGLIFFRIFKAVSLTRDGFIGFFMVGLSAMFFTHVMVNIGMNLGIVPVTGISLPFLSYGGSFIITSLLLIGLSQGMIMGNRRV
jgi:rod shape determining protein RodA